MRTTILVVVSLVALPAFGQSHVYTNADLGQPLERTVTVTPDVLASLAAHQFTAPPAYPPAPRVVIIPGRTGEGPFGPLRGSQNGYPSDGYLSSGLPFNGGVGGFIGMSFIGRRPTRGHTSSHSRRGR